MIIGIEGGIGAGKTLVMTWLMKKEYKECEKPLYANYTLRTLPYTEIDLPWLMEAMQNRYSFERAAIGIDEMHVLLDSRTSQKKTNLVISYFINQTGKEGINLYYTTQDFSQVDVRLRRRTDMAITVQRKGTLHKCLMVDRTTPENKVTRWAVDGKTVWDDYYTKEVIRIT